MARNKDKLTRFVSGKTVLTDGFLNSIYGGLYGTEEEGNYSSVDPLIIGHVHDGQGGDGHAQKINLTSHVVGSIDISSQTKGSLDLSSQVSGSIDLSNQVKGSLDVSFISGSVPVSTVDLSTDTVGSVDLATQVRGSLDISYISGSIASGTVDLATDTIGSIDLVTQVRGSLDASYISGSVDLSTQVRGVLDPSNMYDSSLNRVFDNAVNRGFAIYSLDSEGKEYIRVRDSIDGSAVTSLGVNRISGSGSGSNIIGIYKAQYDNAFDILSLGSATTTVDNLWIKQSDFSESIVFETSFKPDKFNINKLTRCSEGIDLGRITLEINFTNSSVPASTLDVDVSYRYGVIGGSIDNVTNAISVFYGASAPQTISAVDISQNGHLFSTTDYSVRGDANTTYIDIFLNESKINDFLNIIISGSETNGTNIKFVSECFIYASIQNPSGNIGSTADPIYFENLKFNSYIK